MRSARKFRTEEEEEEEEEEEQREEERERFENWKEEKCAENESNLFQKKSLSHTPHRIIQKQEHDAEENAIFHAQGGDEDGEEDGQERAVHFFFSLSRSFLVSLSLTLKARALFVSLLGKEDNDLKRKKFRVSKKGEKLGEKRSCTRRQIILAAARAIYVYIDRDHERIRDTRYAAIYIHINTHIPRRLI